MNDNGIILLMNVSGFSRRKSLIQTLLLFSLVTFQLNHGCYPKPDNFNRLWHDYEIHQ